jgi:signal transduction histidine kinase
MSSLRWFPRLPVAALFARVGALGDRPEDTAEERLQHRFLVWMALFMSGGGLAWGTLAVSAGLGLPAVIPFSYTALTAVNLCVFRVKRSFGPVRRLQVTLSLLLPFLFQTSLGGFAASGAVMLWALLALLGATTVYDTRASVRWMAVFLVLTWVSALADPWARRTFDRGASDDLRVWMAVLTISAVVMIVFGLMTYVLGARTADNVALREANERVSGLVAGLEAQVRRAELAEAAARQASSAKSTFLANMSHELRTPLNAILGYTELLAEETEQASPDLQRIRDAGLLLLQLINDVLDVARIEAGTVEIDQQAVSLEMVVRAVVATLEPLVKKNGNRLSIEIPAGLPPVVTDPLKVSKILYNLIGNSAKFTRDGTIAVRVRQGAGGLLLEVQDSGIGMTAEQLTRVRDPFVQADNSTTRVYGGSGLGLHLVDRYAALLGGELQLASAFGQGTTATVMLAAEPAGTAPTGRGWTSKAPVAA